MMSRFHVILMVCAFSIGCAALFTAQRYALVDNEVKETFIPSGVVYSISEKKDIRKIIILGEGTVQNIDIYARDAEDNWKLLKKIKKTVTFPIEIRTVVHSDAVRILQKTVRGRGQINTVEFYTLEATSQ